MRFFVLTGFFLVVLTSTFGATPERSGFSIAGTTRDGWAQVLRSMGLVESPIAQARVIVVPSDAARAPQDWLAMLDDGAVLILEGDSPLARALGFVARTHTTRIDRICAALDPKLRIEWSEAVEAPVFGMPGGAKVFAKECRGGASLMAGLAHGRGAVLWLAVSPGPEGYERFPYIPQALAELGVQPPFESRRLWAFADAAFRHEPIDFDELAAGWRKSGIAAVHIGAWEFYEPSEQWDRYLHNLIAACHRHLVQVYAWLELPHVSERFWLDHPEWREKTARLRDAHIDWRQLMNLANPDCHAAVARGVRDLIGRFDWDGVNFAELYFDGIQGADKVADFTPMNQDVRREFRQSHGFDPYTLFTGPRDAAKLRTFLDYRADLAARIQEQWIEELEKLRTAKPGLDLVLTHVDDRFDTKMHDAIGADAARALRLLDRHSMTFIVEDPATVWNLGPKRYAEIARRYAPLTSHHDQVAVDINVVDRWGHVRPTMRQTGAELLELIHTASENFARVAYYCEFTVPETDLPFLSAAASVVSRAEEKDGRLTLDSVRGAGVRWNGPALVDGQPWPLQGAGVVRVPPGRHTVEAARELPPVAVLDFNGELESARITPEGAEIVYHSGSRALALLSGKPARVVVDGQEVPLEMVPTRDARFVVLLPSGAHRAVLGGAPTSVSTHE